MTGGEAIAICELARAKGDRPDLREADLREADLREADLSEADLRGAYLSRADLSRAYLRGAYLSRAYLREADLSEADLRGADLSGADLSRAYLRGAYLSRAYLREADLSEADLREADLSGADLRGAYLRRADLRGAEGVDAADQSLPRTKVPVIENLHQKMEEVTRPSGSLDMGQWHACETTHCRAGWAITLAGEAGKKLEAAVGPFQAGCRIYEASTGYVPHFFASTERARADIERCAQEAVQP